MRFLEFFKAWKSFISRIQPFFSMINHWTKKSNHSVSYCDPCLNPIVLSFYFPSLICEILPRSGFKVSFKLFNKIKFFITKGPISSENRRVYFIPWSSSILNYIGQTSRRLKGRIDEHRGNIWNEKISSSPIPPYCLPYNHYFNFKEACVVFSHIFCSCLNLYDAFYTLKCINKLVTDFFLCLLFLTPANFSVSIFSQVLTFLFYFILCILIFKTY